MVFSVDKKIRIGFITAISILLISYILFFFTTDKALKNAAVVNSRKEIIIEADNLLSTLKDMEIVYRGYLLLDNKESLDLYYDGKKKVVIISDKIKSYLTKDSDQFKKIVALDSTINAEIDLMQNGLNLFLKNEFLLTDSVKSIVLLGKAGMDKIRRQTDEIKMAQLNAIEVSDKTTSNYDYIKIVNLIALILCFFIGIYCTNVYAKENKYRKIIAEKSFNDKETLQKKMEVLTGANIQLTEQESVEKFAATGRMARMIAHEVRNPLTNIGLANDQLKDVVEINEESTMLLNMIKRNGERINLLIGDLLTATKFGELHCKSISINDLLDEVVSSLNNNLKQNNVMVKKNYSPNLCNIYADPEKIKIVFYNVILNAIEAIKGTQGFIEISTSINDKQCTIGIKDNGSGIDESSLPKLFEPFFTSKSKGNGLGLTNAQNIVLNHKGKIKAESIEGSPGAFFTISLPCI